MRKLLNILLLTLLPILSQAQSDGKPAELTCGEQVQVTATAKPGYHFEQWSDGNTDNPRWMDVLSDTDLVAIFAKDCERPVVPVIPLYERVLMVDKNAFNKMGFYPAETDISWYRVKGEQDEIGAIHRDDELVHVGYYLTIDISPNKSAWYYAEVPVKAREDMLLCSDTLRSNIWKFDGTQDIDDVYNGAYTCRFTGSGVLISGLPPAGDVVVALCDMAGRCIERHQANNSCTFSPPSAGCYIIQVTTQAGTIGVRYIQP